MGCTVIIDEVYRCFIFLKVRYQLLIRRVHHDMKTGRVNYLSNRFPNFLAWLLASTVNSCFYKMHIYMYTRYIQRILVQVLLQVSSVISDIVTEHANGATNSSRSLLLLAMIRKALWFAWIVAAASDKKVVCPEDANVFGYDSIDALNQDMKAIFETGEHLGTRSHVFRLCPHTIFDGSQRLTPLLNNSHFVCGYDGDPTHKCTISGGKHQIYIADYPGSSMEYISFRGITLSDSEEFGVAAQSRSGVVADFFDCQWVVRCHLCT